MARIVLTCWGSYGDLFPYLAIATRLNALGHTSVLAAPSYYRRKVEQAGVKFAPMGPDVDPSDADTIRRIMDPAHGTEVIVRELLVPAVRQAFDELAPVVAGADLVVTHPVTFASPLAAEAAGVTWVSSVLAPTSMFSLHDFPLLPPVPSLLRVFRRRPWLAAAFMRIARRVTAPWTEPVREFRDELGLPPRGEPLYEGQFSPHGTLALFSPLFGPPQSDWPVDTTATGFVFHRNVQEEAPVSVREFLDAGPPPLVFTLGSSAVGAAGAFYEESAAAAEALGQRAVLLVGPDPRNRPRQLPTRVIAAEYVPHWLLFPRASVVVHHGGIGTTAEALSAGRPMLVVPHAHDQPDNAFRAQRLGVARVLDARAYTRTRVAQHVRALLSKTQYATRAHYVAAELAKENGTEAACAAILRTAGSPGIPRFP